MCSPAAQWIQAVGPQVKVRIRPGTPIRMLQHYSDGTWSAGPRIRPKQLKSWHWKDYPDKPAWKLDRFFKLFGENKLRPSKVKQQFIS